MKERKYFVAIAIFSGMLFIAYAANTTNQNEQQTAKIEKSASGIFTN
jgi:hypothetical protein